MGADLHRCSGVRVTPATRLLMIDHESAEARDLDSLAFRQPLLDDQEDRFHQVLGLFFGQTRTMIDQFHKGGLVQAWVSPLPPSNQPCHIRGLAWECSEPLHSKGRNGRVKQVHLLVGERAVFCTIATRYGNAFLAGWNRAAFVHVE
jgi:hypothetical protein